MFGEHQKNPAPSLGCIRGPSGSPRAQIASGVGSVWSSHNPSDRLFCVAPMIDGPSYQVEDVASLQPGSSPSPFALFTPSMPVRSRLSTEVTPQERIWRQAGMQSAGRRPSNTLFLYCLITSCPRPLEGQRPYRVNS